MKLPTNITKIAVYRRYIDSIENDPSKKISERSFYELWRDACPYIETMKPLSDLCDMCRENSIHITAAKNADQREERLNNALRHLQRAKVQWSFYQEWCCNSTLPKMCRTRSVRRVLVLRTSKVDASAEFSAF
jgi:hypothetical protein